MATLVFAKDFLDDFAKLEPPVRQKVRELPGKFKIATHTGVHLEKLTGAVDDRTRTVRVDQFWRGVVVRLEEARYALLRVMPHDDAIKWALKQRFGVNPVTGIVEILDVPTIAEQVEKMAAQTPPEAPRLFDDRRDKDFTALGVDEHLVPLLRKITAEEELYAIASYLPEAQADAILLLADDKPTDEVWAQLQAEYQIGDAPVDPQDLDAAFSRPGSQSSFVVTSNDSELSALLSGDFEAWRTFLHPTQRSIAYRRSYSGPAKVTGGAGTGKTVVAIHRARFLAQALEKAGDTSNRILVATFTNSLRDNLDATLRAFCTPQEYGRIQVSTVDAFARQTLAEHAGGAPAPIHGQELEEVAKSAATDAGLEVHGLDARFLLTEWEQVILARRLRSITDYANSPRPGRGVRLTHPARRAVWEAIEHMTSKLAGMGRATYLQIADMAADALAGCSSKRYSHAVIDEAQDLHPAQWRLLRAAVTAGTNDLFIVGDAHQRIYDYRVTLSSLGIETRGRSRRLKINYRTSQQILAWALGILTGEQADDLDGDLEPQTGYRSALDGPPPDVVLLPTAKEEAAYVVKAIQTWLDHGVSLSSIGVVARTWGRLKPVQDELDAAGIARVQMGKAVSEPAVHTGTMHSAKGLEFARLVVVGVDSGAVPLRVAVTSTATDPMQHQLDMLRERCLLYVACTRARDQLLVTSPGEPSPLLPTPIDHA